MAKQVKKRGRELLKSELSGRLIASATFSQCCVIPKLGMTECQIWDSTLGDPGVQDPRIRELRQNDLKNYFEWAKAFVARALDDQLTILEELEKHHCCLPCLGRALYEVLRLEAAEDAIRRAARRAPTQIVQGLKAEVARRIAAMMEVFTGQPHYGPLAELLCHGQCIGPLSLPGVLGVPDFRKIRDEKETVFSIELLSQRARSAHVNDVINQVLDQFTEEEIAHIREFIDLPFLWVEQKK